MNMKLKDLNQVIHSELTVIDHTTLIKYEMVNTYSLLFESLEDKEVIGIRAKKNTLIISVR